MASARSWAAIVSADELAQLLATSWDELQQADPRPTDPWTTYIARRLAAELSA